MTGTEQTPLYGPTKAPELADDSVLEAESQRAQELERAIAELEGARARLERDSKAVLDETRNKLVTQLLPILDNLDRAIFAANEHDPDSGLLDGVVLVRQQLIELLRGYGLERFDPLGQRFDPRVHEAVGVVAVDTPQLDGRVAGVWQAGYRVGDRVVRAAQVRVGRYRR